MSDQSPREAGQDGSALLLELARVERLLVAEGRRWRQGEPSTERLESHLRNLTALTGSAPSGEHAMLSERDTAYQEAPTTRVPARQAPRWRGPLALVATLLVVAMAAGVFALLRMETGTGGVQQTTGGTPTPGLVRETAPKPADMRLPLPSDGYLTDISFSSARDGWAVGMTASDQATLVHYKDGIWEPSADTFSGVSLSSVSMVSASDGWAVGARPGGSDPVVLRYTGDVAGGHWRVVSAPELTGRQAQRIHMFSPDSGYMTGAYEVASETDPRFYTDYIMIAVYQNNVWAPMTTPFLAGSAQVAMVSANEGWAAQVKSLTQPGGVTNQQTTIYHYLNGVWSPGPTVSGAATSLSAQSPYDVWLMATQCENCTEPAPRIEQYNGSTWTAVNPPSQSSYETLPAFAASAMVSQTLYDGGASGIWVRYVTQDLANPSTYYTTTWRDDLSGWTLIGSSLAGGQLVAMTADHNGGMWAITQSATANPVVTTVLYELGGAWVLYGQN